MHFRGVIDLVEMISAVSITPLKLLPKVHARYLVISWPN
jgi:hypothetical protein